MQTHRRPLVRFCLATRNEEMARILWTSLSFASSAATEYTMAELDEGWYLLLPAKSERGQTSQRPSQ